MENWVRVGESTLNVAAVLAACVCLWNVGSRFFPHASVDTARSKGSLDNGSTLALPGPPLPRNHPALLVALSTNCHYCQASAGFYRELLKPASEHGFRVIALFPQPVVAGKAYLESLGVVVHEIRQVDYHVIGVSGTPTLVLVDDKGRVKEHWI